LPSTHEQGQLLRGRQLVLSLCNRLPKGRQERQSTLWNGPARIPRQRTEHL